MSLFKGEAKTKELNRITRNKCHEDALESPASGKNGRNIQIIHSATLAAGTGDSPQFFIVHK